MTWWEIALMGIVVMIGEEIGSWLVRKIRDKGR